ncbi:MAG: hypothetical protein ACR2P3_08680 [Geminicoccaceae bacterium]
MTLADDFSRRNIKPVVLFDLELDDGERNFWTGRHLVPVNGKDYLPLPGLEGGISIRQSLELEDLAGDIRLSGVQPEILAIALTDDYQNRPARVHLASRDAAGRIQSSELVFSGLIEDIRIQEGSDDPSLEIIIRGVFADLDDVADIRYSAADQSEIDPHDTFFDFLEAAREAKPPFGA